MIIPMRKYSFLLYHKDYEAFLKNIRQLGVVHIIEKKTNDDDLFRTQKETIRKYQETIKFLENRKSKTSISDAAFVSNDAEKTIKHVNSLKEEYEQKQQEVLSLQKEKLSIEPWGDFSPELIDELKEKGLHIRFYTCTEKSYQTSWEQEYLIEKINIVNGNLYFIIAEREAKDPVISAEEIIPPQKSVSDVIASIENNENRIEQINKELDQIAATSINSLQEKLQEQNNIYDFERARYNTEKHADDKLLVLEGWIPLSKRKKLKQYLDNEELVYLEQKPSPSDKVPILLKNNKFSRLFEPIGKLFSLPDYKEIDLTPFFAPFFMMFFGFCLGDAGYGVVLLLGSSIVKLRLSKKIRPLMTLVQFLGVGTIIFGVLSGTLFGINLLDKQWPVLQNIKAYMLNADEMFNLALVIGIFQILFGLALQATNKIKQFGPAYGIPPIGWILLILSLADMYMLELFPEISQYILYLSLAMIVFFSDPKANIFMRVGKGLWDLYGITGIFGDVLSYIRLFALGISSAILGFVINDIAMQVKDGIPYAGPVLFVIFLIIGHTGNILISSLGSFVHPMRLTFVEFYKNSGFVGGGKEYKPFSNNK